MASESRKKGISIGFPYMGYMRSFKFEAEMTLFAGGAGFDFGQ